MRSEGGLSLLELIVSLGMVTILVALAVPVISAYQKRARRVECENLVKDFLKVQELYYLDNNTFYPLPNEKEIKIAWHQSKGNPPARPEEYIFPKLALEFPIDSHRRYRIKAESKDGEEFMRRYLFELKTDEDFDNNNKIDYYSFEKSIWQEGAKGTYGDADVVNNFWFDIDGVPAWSEYRPSELR